MITPFGCVPGGGSVYVGERRQVAVGPSDRENPSVACGDSSPFRGTLTAHTHASPEREVSLSKKF